ncbi:MAG: cadherin-like domain-containing protein, partial [Dermatophilaceae bacterium]|nr:cadherin-like domain-containing protein [Dermatophilaceae bacterium]
MNATTAGLSIPLASDQSSRWSRLRRLRTRAAAMLVTSALVAAPGIIAMSVVNAPSAAAATTCAPSAGTSISNVTEFDMNVADRTLVSGTTNTAGAVYRYRQADTDNLYDILVTIESVVDGDGNTAGGQYTNPDQDRESAPVPSTVAYMDTPAWDYTVLNGSGVQTSTMRMRYDFVLTGTSTPATLNVLATTVDNDGAVYGDGEGDIATVQEFVKYNSLPDAWMASSTSAMNPQPDGTVMGLTSNLFGVVPEPTASITGVYLGTSSITWTSGHIVTFVPTNPGDSAGPRLGALSFRCEPAAAGVLSPDLKLTKSLDTTGSISNGSTVTYTLTPSNVGFADAASGWTVQEVPQNGLTITAMNGTGYTCDVATLKCTALSALPGDTAAAPITVTATVTATAGTTLRNVAYAALSSTATVPETIPLGTVPTSSTDTTTTTTNNDAQAVFTVDGPVATPDADTTPQNVNVTVDPLGNDSAATDQTLVPTSVLLLDPVSGTYGSTVTVVGEGTYTVDPVTGEVTFDPVASFTGTATAVTYQVADTSGQTATSTITITVTPVVPVATDDSETTPYNTPVVVSVLGNDTAGAVSAPLDPTTVQLLDPVSGTYGSSVTVVGEGTYTVDPVSGEVTFTPEAGYFGTTTPVTYQVADSNGTTTTATITVTVEMPPPPVAAPDADTTPQNVNVTVDPLGNDSAATDQTLVPTSVLLLDPVSGT